MPESAIVVTGASTGIGLACALDLDARGLRVFAGVRKPADADRLRQQASERLCPLMLDVTDPEAVRAAAEAVAAAVGTAGLAGLVNNAGVLMPGPLECLSTARFREQLEVNVLGTHAATQALLPLLRAASGRIVIVGSAGYHPNERRHTTCLLLPERAVMFDAGTGIVRAPEYLLGAELDIFLSHAHIDHVVGLTYLASVRQSHPMRRVSVHGTPGTLRAVEEHLFAEALFPTRPPFDCRPLSDVVELSDGSWMTHFPLRHRGESVGYRLDWPDGRAMAFVTDTFADPEAAYVERIRGVDLLVHECYVGDDRAEWARRTGHGHATAVARVARRAGAKRLALLHFDPLVADADPVGLDAVRAVFPNAILGEDRMEMEF